MEEMEKINSMGGSANKDDDEEDINPVLPGFRFHPTDEELVGFYLRRKVDKRPLSIELIKQVDIYKYDPWDLPKASNMKDKEWYFFCKRGRKYRNSIRPNRVTMSGFWKATGIDRPIYSTDGESTHECIGLKKSLVYYRGSAGKGTKTDWMMHEFRLPAHDHEEKTNQEAEVWTLCRILKRNVSYGKCTPNWREFPGKGHNNPAVDETSKTCSVDSDSHESCYISFRSIDDHDQPRVIGQNKIKKQQVANNQFADETNQQVLVGQVSSMSTHAPSNVSYLSFFNNTTTNNNYDANDQFNKYGDWDELRSVVGVAVTNPFLV